ncbi:MAG: carbohydrate ABC transporter permease [Bacillota bacterium]
MGHLKKILLYAVLVSVALLLLFPVVYVLLGAFKSNRELMVGNTILPTTWHIENFSQAWQLANFAQYTWNSIFLATSVTALKVLMASMTAYALVRRNFPGRALILAGLAGALFLDVGPVTFRPLYQLAVTLKLHNSLWGAILILSAHQATTIFPLVGFFRSIPKELDEAATVDGCSFFRIYWSIILPVSRPALAVVALLAFRQAWNEFLLPGVFTMARPDLRPLTVGVAALRYAESAAAQWNIMMAGAAMSILPILVIYLFANKSMISGLTSGSVKG